MSVYTSLGLSATPAGVRPAFSPKVFNPIIPVNPITVIFVTEDSEKGRIQDAKAVTASDVLTTLNAVMGDKVAQRLYVGAQGNVILVLESNNQANALRGLITMQNLIPGMWHKIPPTKHIAYTNPNDSPVTQTTATNIVVGYLF